MSSNITVRLIGMLLFASAGLLLGLYLYPLLYDTNNPNGFNELVLPLTISGAIVGLLIMPYITVYPVRWARARLRNMTAAELLSLAVGLFVGLLLGALFSWPLSNLPGAFGQITPTVVSII